MLSTSEYISGYISHFSTPNGIKNSHVVVMIPLYLTTKGFVEKRKKHYYNNHHIVLYAVMNPIKKG